MFCQNCGNKLDDDARFCPKCGTKTSETSIPAPQGEKDEFFKDVTPPPPRISATLSAGAVSTADSPTALLRTATRKQNEHACNRRLCSFLLRCHRRSYLLDHRIETVQSDEGRRKRSGHCGDRDQFGFHGDFLPPLHDCFFQSMVVVYLTAQKQLSRLAVYFIGIKAGTIISPCFSSTVIL